MGFPVSNDQVAGLFHMDDLRTGRHVIRDQSHMALSDFWVKSLWSVLVEPSFHSPALIVVVNADLGYGADWIKGVLIATPDELPQPVDLKGWGDPVSACLKTTSLLSLEAEHGMSLDGIGYTLTIDNNLEAVVGFSTPTHPDAVRLEKAFLSAAATIVELQKDKAGGGFLPIWRQYARK